MPTLQRVRRVGHDGQELSVYQSSAEGKRAWLYLIHGYAEHIDRYTEWVRFLEAHGIGVTTADQRGHGLSAGKRGHVDSFHEYTSDISALSADLPKLPRFIMGHSLGGLIASHYFLNYQHDFMGAVILSPMFGLTHRLVIKEAFGRLFGRIIPRVSMTSEIDARTLSKDHDRVRQYEADPLIFNTTTPGFYVAMVRFIAETENGNLNSKRPLLYSHGEQDELCSYKNSRRFYDSLRMPSKEALPAPQGYHELLNDTERDATMRAIVAWLDRELARAA